MPAAFIVTKHAIGTIIQPPEAHAEGGWEFVGTQVSAVMRDKNDAPAPKTLSKMEFEKQRRAWLREDSDVVRNPEDFVPKTAPVPSHQFEYLDETVYATWKML